VYNWFRIYLNGEDGKKVFYFVRLVIILDEETRTIDYETTNTAVTGRLNKMIIRLLLYNQ